MAGVNPPSRHVGELLTAYLDGELRNNELEAVVAHLSNCVHCIREFHELKETRAALRSLPHLIPPEHLVPSEHYGASLSAYLDGELAAAEYRKVFHHVQDCTECRAELHELDAARTAVRSLPGLEPPEFLDVSRYRRIGPRSLRRGRVVAAIAGVAAAVVLAVGIGTSSEGPESSVDLDSFADRHVARASVEPVFQMIPAVSPGSAAP